MRGTERLRSFVVLVFLVSLVGTSACWIEEPEPPPPFDCAAIDRADERFPDRCGDAGVDPVDAGP